jgi:enoyl-CoA hydratase/carnithine racemase
LPTQYQLESLPAATILRLTSSDNTNRLTRQCVVALIETVLHLRSSPKPLILAGNPHFFSAGADLAEIAALTGPAALEFSKLGQRLMNAVAVYPAPTYAAIEGYCMGGGLDLALACRHRIASPRAIFGHRGAALGLITGWGGTQRLPRQIGKDRALYMFLAAEKLDAVEAQRIGLVDAVVENPIAEAEKQLSTFSSLHASAT